MKRRVILLVLIILLSSFISADIIFNGQFNQIYSIGDNIFVPVTIKSVRDVSGIFQMDLICNNGTSTNFYKNGVKLYSGEEKGMDSSLVLIKNIIGNNKGTCKIKATLNDEYVISDEFKISDLLIINGNLAKTEFDAGEGVSITGKVTRENGENSNGIIEAKIITGDINQEIITYETINGGIFSVNISLPDTLKAGAYLLEIKAYEKDSDGVTTNNGLYDYNIYVNQVPTNLELIFENKEINPGETLKVKAILHDQTGDSINSSVFITIKNSADKILEQREVSTDEFVEYISKSNTIPEEWKVFATSNKLSSEDTAKIKEKSEIKIEIVNKTVSITNTGNVFYNKTLLVKIGDNPLNLQVELDVGESKKYSLSAPDGEYSVKVVADGDNEISEIMSLTGKAVGIKETSNISLTFFFWVLLILVLVVVAFFAYKKVYKKPFLGKFKFNFKKKETSLPTIKDNKIVRENNKAEMSSSIKGEKQDASVVCLKIKDLRELKSNKGSVSDTLRKIRDITDERKAVIYEAQDYLFFILAPTKTKTVQNEKTALEIADMTNEILKDHNRTFNQKINFGVSINYGTIVAKIEDGVFKFMTMDSLILNAKKIASLADGELLIGNKMNDLLRVHIKTDKTVRDGIPVFSIREVKKENEEARKFIAKFMEKQRKG